MCLLCGLFLGALGVALLGLGLSLLDGGGLLHWCGFGFGLLCGGGFLGCLLALFLGHGLDGCFQLVIDGGGYKLLDVVFDEGNLYAVTDYTEASLADAKGLVSIPIDKIPTRKKNSANIWCPASLRYWFRATKDFMKQGSYYTNPADAQIAAVSGHICDNNGWRFCGTDYLGGSKHLIAKGDHNFVWVDNTEQVRFGRFTGPNNKGEVFVSVRTPDPAYASGEAGMRMSHRQYVNLTEVMRASGATDFFEGWQGTPY